MITQILPQSTALRKALAWGVHLFTATGAVWGLLSLIAIHEHQWRVAFIWIAVSILVDSVDGSLARWLRIKEHTATFDGALLDNIIDYLTYVIVPAFFFYEAGMLPPQAVLAGPILIVLTSAYQFCQPDAKTADHYFTGFPSYWNIVVIYLFLLGLNPWINLGFIVFFSILVFIPIKYVYPSRTRLHQRLTLLLTAIWGVIGVIILFQYPHVSLWLVWASFLYIAYYVGLSLAPMLKPR